NYIWETTDASAILNRLDPETLLNVDDYVSFAGDHVDTWRLLWETALEGVSSGNPTEVLDVLQITDNINTLQSLPDALGGTPDGSDGLLSGLPTGDLLGGTSDLLGPAGSLLGGDSPQGSDGSDGSDDSDGNPRSEEHTSELQSRFDL